MIREFNQGTSKKTKIILIVLASVLLAGGVVGIVLGVTRPWESSNPPSNVPVTVPNVPGPTPAQPPSVPNTPINGLNGTYFITRDDNYLMHTFGNLVELAPLFDPHDQAWIFTEVYDGTYTIQNKHNLKYMTGFKWDPVINKRVLPPDEIPHVMIELHELHPTHRDQLWDLRQINTTQTHDTLIQLVGSDEYVAFPRESETAALDSIGTTFAILDYDPDLKPSNHEHGGETDKEPSGWVVYNTDDMPKQIRHAHLDDVLTMRPDDTVGLFRNYHMEEQFWYTVRIPQEGEYPRRYPYTFYIKSFDGKFLTRTLNTVTLEPLNDEHKLFQTWLLRTSSQKGSIGLQNSGDYLYINDTDGWNLKFQNLDTGWNSWIIDNKDLEDVDSSEPVNV